MKRIISTLFGLAVLCVFAQAHAVPATVSFTGRLSTSSGPVSGAVTVTFTLFDQAANGTDQWSETRSLTATSTGLVYADLGAMTTLDSTILDNSPLYLEIQVGTEVLSPRLPLQSVPYAIRSEVANTAETLGTISPGDVVTAVNASGGISASRSGNTVTLTGAVSGTAPISVSAGNVSLTTCAANQIYKMTGGNWQCTADLDTNTTYAAAANSGVVLNGTLFGLTTCATGQVLKSTGTGTWGCSADDTGGDILGITTASGSGLDGGCTSGTCTLTVDPTDFNGSAPAVSAFMNTNISLTSTYATLHSQSITTPRAGYVVAMYDGILSPQNLSALNSVICANIGFTTSSTGTPSPAVVACETWSGEGSVSYGRSSYASVIPVGAGTTTVYLRARVTSSSFQANMYNHNLVLFFIPN